MIRPFTLLCMVAACGSGLYLYQTKHRVMLLDRDITQTVQATSAARERAGVLRTEWTLLNDLERLRALSDQYLQLRPVAPSQFTTLAELTNRLPAPRAPEPEPEPAATPALLSNGAAGPADEPDTDLASLPTPPVPPPVLPHPVQVASVQAPAPQILAKDPAKEAAREAAAKAAAKATAEATAARAAERRQMAEAAPRPLPAPRPATSMPASVPSSGPTAAVYTQPQASSLGMATRTALPPPVPVSAYQYSSPN